MTLTFGIDYDGTFSADPELFRCLVRLLQSRGHHAVCVTGRSDDGIWGHEVREQVGDLMPIVFAGRRWKRTAAMQDGFKIDIWMDDFPEYVGIQDPALASHKSDAELSGSRPLVR